MKIRKRFKTKAPDFSNVILSDSVHRLATTDAVRYEKAEKNFHSKKYREAHAHSERLRLEFVLSHMGHHICEWCKKTGIYKWNGKFACSLHRSLLTSSQSKPLTRSKEGK